MPIIIQSFDAIYPMLLTAPLDKLQTNEETKKINRVMPYNLNQNSGMKLTH